MTALDNQAGSMPSTPQCTPYSKGSGLLVHGHGQRLDSIDPAWSIAQLIDAGFLVFRGFEADLTTFSELVVRHSARVTLDPARSFHAGKVAQKVDAGYDAMGLHLENGNSPFCPDLVWFLCDRAPRQGSQTTVCDGLAVWRHASARARDSFGSREIVYERRVEEDKWKTFVFYHLGATKPRQDITIDDLRGLTNDEASMTVRELPDNSIIYSFRTMAAHSTRFGQELAWANSIFGPSYNYEAPRITFADGEEIPAALLEEMRQLSERLTVNLDWQTGDIALIDNTRVMHGRRAIDDPERRIFNALSYVAPGLVPSVAANGAAQGAR